MHYENTGKLLSDVYPAETIGPVRRQRVRESRTHLVGQGGCGAFGGWRANRRCARVVAGAE
eukprot:11187918-Lingulodinium_polyedra.AAC.1